MFDGRSDVTGVIKGDAVKKIQSRGCDRHTWSVESVVCETKQHWCLYMCGLYVTYKCTNLYRIKYAFIYCNFLVFGIG